MKINVQMPARLGRHYIDRENGKVYKMSPTFDVTAYDDNQNKISELSGRIPFGPEFYEWYKHKVPNTAARLGEDFSFKGSITPVFSKNIPKDAYLYYGNGPSIFDSKSGIIGSTPDTSKYGLSKVPGGVFNAPGLLNPIGWGHSSTPPSTLRNYVYSVKLDAPNPLRNMKKGEILSNILNYSGDFSPIFGPLYDYKDPEYPWDEDPTGEKKLKEGMYGPRPTDQWVPRLKEDGSPMLNAEGKPIWVPVPLVQNLPIYNLNAKIWEDDPERAWALLDKIEDADRWQSWGKASRYADWDGMPHQHKIRGANDYEDVPFDYNEENTKLLDKAGYFPYLDIDKDTRHQMKRQGKFDSKLAKRKEATEKEVENNPLSEEDKLKSEVSLAKHQSGEKSNPAVVTFTNGGEPSKKVKSQGERNKARKNAIQFAAKSDKVKDLRDKLGITEDDFEGLKSFVTQGMFDSDFGGKPFEVTIPEMLKRYAEHKEAKTAGADTQRNILEGIKDFGQIRIGD